MKNRKALIFDMGGVLIDLDLPACRDAFRQVLGYEKIDEILDPWHQKGIIGELEEGLMSADEFRAAVLSESNEGARAEDVDECFSKILSSIEPFKVKLLHSLAESYDLYMLSNNNPIALPYAVKLFANAGVDVHKLFRKLYMSFQMKALKPSEKFYKAVIDDVGREVGDMLFIDDSVKNVEGAVAAGLPAVHYVPGDDLGALLAEALGDETIIRRDR